jgi:D-3-phosphoglycerate dehydrogenase
MAIPAAFLAVITDSEFASDEPERRELDGLAEVRRHSCVSEEEVIAAAARADAILVQYAPITRRVIESLLQCRVIARYGIGVDMIDLDAARRREIQVVHVPDYCVEEVSDHTMALMLAASRKLLLLHRSVAEGHWHFSVAAPIQRFQDLTVGLLGFGKIARRIAEKLKPFGCRILTCDPYAQEPAVRSQGVELVGVEALLGDSDIISIHAPLTAQTRHLLDWDAFGKMRRKPILVNTSRGAVIDESALVRALDAGLVAGAALDVLEEEPIGAGNRLVGRDNVLLTPHSAFYSVGSLHQLQVLTARGAAQVLRGEKPQYPVAG